MGGGLGCEEEDDGEEEGEGGDHVFGGEEDSGVSRQLSIGVEER